jgi:hypothetical protein
MEKVKIIVSTLGYDNRFIIPKSKTVRFLKNLKKHYLKEIDKYGYLTITIMKL